MSTPYDDSNTAHVARERAREALCNGRVASWLAPDGSLVARCTRCGRSLQWTAAEVAAYGLAAGASFAPCDAARKAAR